MTRTTRRLLISGGLAAALTPALATAQAASRKSAPVRRLFPYLDRYLAIAPASRNRFRLVYRLSRDGRPAAGLRGWIGEGASRTELSVGPDGIVRPLPTLAQLRANTPVTFDVPESTRFSINMGIEPSMAPAATLSVPELAAALTQVNTALREAAGVIRFAVPRFTRIVFPGGQGAEVALADGRRVRLPVANGTASFDPAAHAGARSIHFTRAPNRLVFAPAR